MTDPRSADPSAAQAGQPSEEEMRAYLEAVRDADVVELVAQAYSLLGTGAEVKLGRPDARPLIDGLAALVEATGPALPPDLVTRMRQQIGQLQAAQVQLEAQAGEAAEAAEGGPSAGEATAGQGRESGEASPPGPSGQQPSSPPGQPSGADQRMTDRLWVPGRDAPPPGR